MNGLESFETCVACGLPASGSDGLPVGDSGEVVANDYPGTWGAVAACAGCRSVNDAGGPAALEAHVKATAALREKMLATIAIVSAMSEKFVELGNHVLTDVE